MISCNTFAGCVPAQRLTRPFCTAQSEGGARACAIVCAAAEGFAGVVKLLIERKADVNLSKGLVSWARAAAACLSLRHREPRFAPIRSLSL